MSQNGHEQIAIQITLYVLTAILTIYNCYLQRPGREKNRYTFPNTHVTGTQSMCIRPGYRHVCLYDMYVVHQLFSVFGCFSKRLRF